VIDTHTHNLIFYNQIMTESKLVYMAISFSQAKAREEQTTTA